ncbi:uncharacterized protein LOC127811542 [Diospyros lotus]|uniref:uncharacterized protein LOC127811542 n=1 Tax=Diospyros lotus TaxID=55363 RepID=UPI0022597B6F|nr:uncharacterized protein LOC127811542 [Diospyros lotus]
MSNVIEYFNVLVELWHEMDMFYTISWESPTDSNKYNKMIEKDRIFDFLHGLNPDLDELRGRILGTKPLPSLKEVFAEVRREESRHKVMLQHQIDPVLPHQNSALASIKQGDLLPKTQGREKIWRDHCKKPYHTKATCWKIHGKLANWKPRPRKESSRFAYNVEVSAETKPSLNLFEDQIQALYRLLNQGTIQSSSNNPQSTASMALQGPSIGENDWQC